MASEVVYAPGVFDMLHYGHLQFLKRARAFGARLLVGVQDDRSVVSQKGIPPTVPVFERMEIIRHFAFVDDVVSYRDTDQSELLRYLNIDVFATNPEYGCQMDDPGPARTITYCQSQDIRIVRIPVTNGISSTLMRERAARFWQEYSSTTSSGEYSGMLLRGQDASHAVQRTADEVAAILAVCGSDSVHHHLLELGCGAGRLLKCLAPHFASVTGVDASPEMIRMAKNCLESAPGEIQLWCGRAEEFRDGITRDVVLFAGVLPYLDDDAGESLVSSLASHLVRCDGTIIIREPLSTEPKPVLVYNQFSSALGRLYSAYYRTPDQVCAMMSKLGFRERTRQTLEQHHVDTALFLMRFTADDR
jgi:glycerol-3-phosphate cytidylyltransferase